MVEKNDGTKEPLIDTGSYAAGYRQAVLDLAGGAPSNEPGIPTIFFAVLFVSFLCFKLAVFLDEK